MPDDVQAALDEAFDQPLSDRKRAPTKKRKKRLKVKKGCTPFTDLLKGRDK